MAGNSFGQVFRITTYGESHGVSIGVIIDGCPSGLAVAAADIQAELNRRRPGQSSLVSPRKEADEVQILSGIKDGYTLGTPIALSIANQDARPKDYDSVARAYRPSHADFTWEEKFGVREHRGGGRSSARETAARVAAGAVAKKLLAASGIRVWAYVSSVGDLHLHKVYTELNPKEVERSLVRCPDMEMSQRFEAKIVDAQSKGDTLGGTITAIIEGCPAGLGEPVFDKLHAALGKAILSINACKGFEIGSGFAGTELYGSEHNDSFSTENNRIITTTNHSGGIQGGISNGMDIYFRAAFKPIATISQQQNTIDAEKQPIILAVSGRHDACVLPRAVPIVEAMAALTMADYLLLARLNLLHPQFRKLV